VKTISGLQGKNPLKTILALGAIALMLSACGGESTEQLPNTSSSSGTETYSGPAPATDDVQIFQREVWKKLKDDNHCGACHNAGGQSPQFVHDGDINIAYAQAKSVVNLSDISQSLMVTKVAGGHNCWLSSTSACVDIIINYLTNWAGGAEGEAKTIELSAPEDHDPGNTLTFPADSSRFETTVYPVLRNYCVDCHVEGIQTPFFASSDVDTAYDQAKSRINLSTPEDSRLVQRLATDFHNCWDAGCEESARIMRAAIEAFAGDLELTPIDPQLLVSKALNLENDGLKANTSGRFEDNVIALYEFKAGEGQTAFDTSGVEPALNLTLSGNTEWVNGWGIKLGDEIKDTNGSTLIRSGKAQGSTAASKKLHTQLTLAGEYTIEAWVVPGNVTIEDARIVTYSGSSTVRNLTLSQTLQRYEVLHRSTTSDENEPLATDNDAKLLQATLQHVVVTYTPSTGRRIYVNGQDSGVRDPDAPGLFSEWDDSLAFILGNEADRGSHWEGVIRMVAVHNRALTPEQIAANYDAGVGQKFYLLFGVSHLIDVPQAYIVFEVNQFDSYSYGFLNPFFISLDSSAEPSDIPLKGMRLGINGKEATAGQVWANLDVTLNSDDYEPGIGQPLSSTYSRSEPDLIEEPTPADLPASSEIGLKTFDEINESMSRMTGVPKTRAAVMNTYETVKQQLPSVENIQGFLSAHQMAITQMAIQYCDALVADTSLRSAFFPGFDFSALAESAFDATGKNQVIEPLLERFVGTGLNSQPSDTDIESELGDLMDRLTSCDSGCSSDRTETVVKASCAAVLGSATTLVQ